MKTQKWIKYSSHGTWYRIKLNADGTDEVQAYYQPNVTRRGTWIPAHHYSSIVRSLNAQQGA